MSERIASKTGVSFFIAIRSNDYGNHENIAQKAVSEQERNLLHSDNATRDFQRKRKIVKRPDVWTPATGAGNGQGTDVVKFRPDQQTCRSISPSKVRAATRSGVSKPSVNQA
jgi:hypothetical protein